MVQQCVATILAWLQIRAGLAVQLKEAVGSAYIMAREEQLWRRAKKRLKADCPNLVLLGNPDLPRLPVVSFVVRNPKSGLLLHYNFVCAVLNDLFGLQARGGCACAGPYAQVWCGGIRNIASVLPDGSIKPTWFLLSLEATKSC